MAGLTAVQLTVALSLSMGTSISESAENAGITRQTIHKWIKDDDEFIAHLNALKLENRSAATTAIQSSAVLAVKTISEIMQNSANDAVRLACAKEVLSMAGLTRENIGPDTTEGIRRQKEKNRKNAARMAELDAYL